MSYVVMSREFQYNDEYFYVDDDQVGIPRKIFKTLESAQKHCSKMCLEWFKGQDINYLSGYIGQDCDDYEEAEKKLSKLRKDLKNRLNTGPYEWSKEKTYIPKDATQEELFSVWSVMQNYMLAPYFVLEVK